MKNFQPREAHSCFYIFLPFLIYSCISITADKYVTLIRALNTPEISQSLNTHSDKLTTVNWLKLKDKTSPSLLLPMLICYDCFHDYHKLVSILTSSLMKSFTFASNGHRNEIFTWDTKFPLLFKLHFYSPYVEPCHCAYISTQYKLNYFFVSYYI